MKDNKYYFGILVLLLVVLVIISIILAVSFGAVQISFIDTYKVIIGKTFNRPDLYSEIIIYGVSRTMGYRGISNEKLLYCCGRKNIPNDGKIFIGRVDSKAVTSEQEKYFIL